jgi:hypothetical protein
MGQESDRLIDASLDDGGLAPIDQEIIMQQQRTFSSESDEDALNADATTAKEEIERTRERMSGTIDAISERLDPQTLKQQAKDAVRDATIGKVESAAKSAGATAKDTFNTASATAKDTFNTASATVKDTFTTAGETLSGVAHKVRETVVSVSSSTGHGAQPDGPVGADSMNVTENGSGSDGILRSGYMKISPRIRDTAYQAQSGFRQGLEKRPLVMGAALIGLGALVGFALPETEQENRLLGRMGSRAFSSRRGFTEDQAG